MISSSARASRTLRRSHNKSSIEGLLELLGTRIAEEARHTLAQALEDGEGQHDAVTARLPRRVHLILDVLYFPGSLAGAALDDAILLKVLAPESIIALSTFQNAPLFTLSVSQQCFADQQPNAEHLGFLV